MSYSSIGASSSHKNGMEEEVMGSRPTGYVCDLMIYIHIHITHTHLPAFLHNCGIFCVVCRAIVVARAPAVGDISGNPLVKV